MTFYYNINHGFAAKKKAERLQSKIETQLVSAGGRILRRGLLGILTR